MSRWTSSVIRDDEGATSLEYGIMLVLATAALTVILLLALTGNLI